MLVINGYLMNIQAGEDLAVGDWVYIDPADGRAKKAENTVDKAAQAMVSLAVDASDITQVYCSGIITDHPNTFTPGATYYASDTPGVITATRPVSGGYQVVGYAAEENVL